MFFSVKHFGTGVIIATAFIHVFYSPYRRDDSLGLRVVIAERIRQFDFPVFTCVFHGKVSFHGGINSHDSNASDFLCRVCVVALFNPD